MVRLIRQRLDFFLLLLRRLRPGNRKLLRLLLPRPLQLYRLLANTGRKAHYFRNSLLLHPSRHLNMPDKLSRSTFFLQRIEVDSSGGGDSGTGF